MTVIYPTFTSLYFKAVYVVTAYTTAKLVFSILVEFTMAYPGCPDSKYPNGAIMLTSNQDFSMRMVEVKQVQAALNLIGTENFIVKVQVPFFASRHDFRISFRV